MAAEDTKGKKRKGATDAAPKAKKAKKSDEVAPVAKPAKAPKSAPTPADSKPVKSKSSRKQAADFFSEDEAPAAESAPVKPTKGGKKSKAPAANGDVAEPAAEPEVQEKPKKGGKKAKAAAAEDAPVAEAPKEKTKKAAKGKKAEAVPAEEAGPVVEESASKKTKKSKTSKKEPEPAPEVTEEADEIEVGADEDDQTAALLAGFESDEEADPEEDEDFDENAVIPKLSKKQKTALAKAEKSAKANEPGVVYVGHVPRGFFEPQMKKYFSQFGKVNQLRLSRNKKTGASKHYAFVEFASSEVADIVARTMDNYLLFGHILKCKLIPSEQVRDDLFKGAGERFKIDPRNKKAGLEMARGVERAQWEKRVENENKRRTGKAKALKENFGYEYEAPNVKSVADVPKQLENGQAQHAIEEAPVEETPAIEEPKPKKGRKAAKTKEEPEVVEDAQPAKAKKGSKRKSDVAEEVPEAEAAPKTKKIKKAAAPAVTDETPEKKRKAKPEPEAAKPKKAKKAAKA